MRSRPALVGVGVLREVLLARTIQYIPWFCKAITGGLAAVQAPESAWNFGIAENLGFVSNSYTCVRMNVYPRRCFSNNTGRMQLHHFRRLRTTA